MTSESLPLTPAIPFEESAELDYGPELDDDELACVVGGLARIWIGPEPDSRDEDGQL